MKQKIQIRGLRFIGVSTLVFSVEYLLTIFLAEAIHLHAVIAYAIALVIGANIAYIYHNKYTFNQEKLYNTKAIQLFSLIYGAEIILNWALTSALTLHVISYWLAIPLVTGTTGIVNFFLYDRFVFTQVK